jgi:HD-GYP domain-containing protein (c-di-GMP phosphodiesterase class II)
MDQPLQTKPVLPGERLKSILGAIAESLGFRAAFSAAGGAEAAPEEGSSTMVLDEFGLRVSLNGPRSRHKQMVKVIGRVAAEIAEEEREAASLTQEIVDRYEQLSMLFEMSERLGSARDNKSRMQAILETAIESVSAREGCLLLTNGGCQTAGPAGDAGPSPRLCQISEKTIESRRPAVDERQYISLPLLVDYQNVIGALTLGAGSKGVYRSGELKLLSTLSSYAALLLESGRLYEDLEVLFFGTIRSMVEAIDAKHPMTRGHSERVRRYTARIGEALGMPAQELKRLELGALLHDVGKIGLPDSILNNNLRELTPAQWALVQQHPQIGTAILSPVSQLKDILPAIGEHHERIDGRGYPRGMKGPDISWYARIIAVADAFDAMTTERPYRAIFTQEQALGELRQHAGKQFDPRIVELFASSIDT